MSPERVGNGMGWGTLRGMSELNPEVFRFLFALGWIDGELRESEAHVILEAARAEGFDEATLTTLEQCAHRPVDFTEIDQTALDVDSRLYVYAISSWIAHTDGRVSAEEQAALHAVATLVGVTGMGRSEMDGVVQDFLGRAFDALLLRDAIRKRARSLQP